MVVDGPVHNELLRIALEASARLGRHVSLSRVMNACLAEGLEAVCLEYGVELPSKKLQPKKVKTDPKSPRAGTGVLYRRSRHQAKLKKERQEERVEIQKRAAIAVAKREAKEAEEKKNRERENGNESERDVYVGLALQRD